MSSKIADEPDNKSAIKSDLSSSNPDPKKVLGKKPKPALKPEEVVEELPTLKSKPKVTPEPAVEPPVVKKKVVKKPRYEELPAIPDYDHPELEVYEESDFDPSKKIKEEEVLPEKEPAKAAAKVEKPVKPKASKSKYEDLPEIEEYVRPPLEKYEKTSFEPLVKEEATPKIVVAEKVADAPEPKKDVKKVEKPKPKVIEKKPESVAESMFKLKPVVKKPKEEPKPVESADVTITNKKPPPAKTSTEDSAEAKITTKKAKPPTTVEESASKNVTVRGKELLNPIDEDPIEYIEEDSDEKELSKPEDDGSKKSVSFDKEAKTDDLKNKVRRKKYDPMAYIPDKEDVVMEEETPSDPNPEPQSNIPKQAPRARYDPLKFIPDKDDVTPVDNLDGSKDTEVNTTTSTCTNKSKQNILYI